MANRRLLYDVNDRPKFKHLILYAFQMLLAILAATVAVPTIIGLPSQIPAAILGAGVGTLVYIFFTKGKSPIVISSSFAFLPAFATAIAFGYMGILLGGIFAGLMYVIIALIVKFAGTRWVNRLMPAVIIGPVVALIGLGLAPNAVADLTAANSSDPFSSYNLVALLCGLITLFTVVICSVQNRFRAAKLFPFIIGIGVGYLFATIFTLIGNATGVSYLKIVNWDNLIKSFSPVTINSFFSVPKISLVEGIKEMIHGGPSHALILEQANFYFAKYPEWFMGITISEANIAQITRILVDKQVIVGQLNGLGVAGIAIAFCPIALVAFAEHLADHKNISSIIGHDLINDQPGLHRTLLGDGVGTMMGTAFGVCPNTSYGEGIACVALTRNASVATSFATACICIILSFLSPFSMILQTVPRCVMGGVCLALYGYISVSGLKMFKEVDLDNNVNLLTVCAILIAGIGGLSLQIPYIIGKDPASCRYITIGAIATALLLGVAIYNVAGKISKREKHVVAEINTQIRGEDLVRVYLKQINLDKLVQGLLIFGFMHENIDLTVAQLSNFLRNQNMLSHLTDKELVTLIKLFELKGYKKGMKQSQLIDLIIKDCHDIDQKMVKPISGGEIH